jgi:hypothetical protein
MQEALVQKQHIYVRLLNVIAEDNISRFFQILLKKIGVLCAVDQSLNSRSTCTSISRHVPRFNKIRTIDFTSNQKKVT